MDLKNLPKSPLENAVLMMAHFKGDHRNAEARAWEFYYQTPTSDEGVRGYWSNTACHIARDYWCKQDDEKEASRGAA